MGSYLPGIGLVALTFLIVYSVAFDFNVPQKLTDGILVTGGRETRGHVATWTLIVVLDAPRPDVTFRSKVQQLRSYIHSVLLDHRSPNVTRWSWLQRLQAIADQMPHSIPHGRRVRRGFFDLGGTILNKVFGIVTEAQMDTTRHWIQQVRSDNERVIHNTNELVTVVNHTFAEVRLNRKHLRDIEAYISKLHEHMTTWTAISTIAFERVRVSLRIDQCLSALESIHNYWFHQQDLYRRQRAALESGLLTEDILPPADLGTILAASRRVGQYAPGAEWFYQFIRIRPMWEDKEALVFTADLPLTDRVKYLRYHLWSWPVAHNASGYSLQIQVPTDLAYDTEGGDMFIPHDCLGRDPSICKTGPVFTKDGLTCPRGILTNNQALRNTCQVTINRSPGGTNIIRQLATNTFVMLSQGESFNVFCPGVPSEAGLLSYGLYVIHVLAGCRISGKVWTLHGIFKHSAKIELVLPEINVAPLNWSELVSHPLIHHKLQSPKWKFLPVIKDVPIAELQSSDDISELINWDSSSHHAWWSFVLLIIPIVLGAWLLYRFRNKFLNCCRSRQRPDVTTPTDVELREITPIVSPECVAMMRDHANILTMTPE